MTVTVEPAVWASHDELAEAASGRIVRLIAAPHVRFRRDGDRWRELPRDSTPKHAPLRIVPTWRLFLLGAVFADDTAA